MKRDPAKGGIVKAPGAYPFMGNIGTVLPLRRRNVKKIDENIEIKIKSIDSSDVKKIGRLIKKALRCTHR